MKKLFLSFALIVGLLASASTAMAQTVNMSRYITLTVKNGKKINLDFKAAAEGTPVRIVSGSNTQDITVGTDWYDGGDPSTYTVTAYASTMTVYGDIIGFKCSENGANLTAIDVSHNTLLTELYCHNNSLNSLDVSQNTQLKELYCGNNQLTTLDVLQNTQLTKLNCFDSNLSSLDVSNNTQLTFLGCARNQLTSLDVSKNTQLEDLWCYNNKFTTAALNDIYCSLPNRTGKDNGVIQPVFNSSSSYNDTVLATNKANATAKNWKVQYWLNNADIPTTGTYVCPPTTYDLEIAGVQVTSANCSDLSVIPDVTGTVKYDPATKVLTLDGATIQKTNTSAAIKSNIDGLTIKVIGTNTLTTSKTTLYFEKPLTITGGGVLNANSGTTCAIFANEINLTIDGCTVNAKGVYGIIGNNASSKTLTIKNSTVTAEGTEGSITDFAGITLDGCTITEPEGAAFDASLKAIALNGQKVKSKVVIIPALSNMSRYITLTVKQYSAIKLDFKAVANGTHVSIVNGSTMQDIIVDTDWKGTDYYTAAVSTKMKIYGDLTGFDCGGNGANLTAIDVSHNTQLTELSCFNNQLLSNLDVSRNTQLTWLNCTGNNLSSLDVSRNTKLTYLNCGGNAFTTETIDDIYCALPVRQAADDARIYPLGKSSDPEAITVLATNAQNAIDKNWRVKYASNGTDIATTGTYVCPTTTYALEIAGVQVTSANCSDLSVIDSVSGTVKYDPANKVLTLQNATIQINTTKAIKSNIDGLTIKVIGTNNLTTGNNTALYLTEPLTITGGGVLNAKSGGECGIYANETNLTIDGCTVNAKGKWGIAGWNGSSETLTIKNSTVTAEGASNGCSIADFASLTLDGCAITEPVGAAFDTSLKAVALNGEKVKSKVVISKNSTDIAEAAAEQALTLYPNPVADVLYLSATARTIRIYNVYGIEVAHATDTDRVEVSHLPAGVYTVKADGMVAKMIKR